MKQQNIETYGVVTQELGNAMFAVQLDNIAESRILATISGKIRQFRINIRVGDKVKLEMSPYDLTKGRIVLRIQNKPNQQQSATNNSNKKKKKKKK